jgi:uncharacterized protein YbjQ (UPF0145 family)
MVRSAPESTWPCPDCGRQVARHLARCPHCAPAQAARARPPIIVVSTDGVPGMDVTHVCGLVTGVTVRSRDLFSDFGSSLKSLVGGELGGATRMVHESRREAQERMEDAALALDANAVVGVRFDTESVGSGSSQSSAVVAYGTAVRVRRPDPVAR